MAIKRFLFVLLAVVFLPTFGFAQKAKPQAKNVATHPKPVSKPAKPAAKRVVETSLPKAPTPAPIENALFWRVTGRGIQQPSYILGTFHLFGGEYLQRNMPFVMQMLAQEQGLIGEMSLDSASLMKIALMVMRPAEKPLDSLMSDGDYILLTERFKELTGQNLDNYKKLSPVIPLQIMQMAVFARQYPQLVTGPKNEPMDLFLQNAVRKMGFPVVGLETAQEQFDILYRKIPAEQMAKQLIEMTTDTQKTYAENNRLIADYKRGNLDGLYKLLLSGEFTAAETDALLKSRNDNWLQQLPALFSQHGWVVAVGALHLAGPDGLVARLRQMGYQVDPVETQE